MSGLVPCLEIGTLEAKTQLSALLAAVEQGEVYYITRHGKRVAKLCPVTDTKAQRRAGFARGTFIAMTDDFDDSVEGLLDQE